MSVCSAQNTTANSDELPTNSVTCELSQMNICKLIMLNTDAYSLEEVNM